ncbi:MAG TPA: ATP-dependent 6-phosphofructokinase [Anaerolineales bacterium]|nr:ATP-dependent 6-phosphofructokinase [Anaerolineales bacterium]
MRIGILTGGGDVPGLNVAIKAVVLAAEEMGWDVLGVRRGWGGLLHYNPAADSHTNTGLVLPLTRETVRTVDRDGGTFLHTSRTNPQKVKPKDLPEFLKSQYPLEEGKTTVDCTDHTLRVLSHLKVDALIPIGGDDTLSFAARLHKEGVKVVAIPKTMDNDVYGTDYCIGFSTAVSRSVEFIHALRTPSGSHERVLMVELFGRNSGETALIAAYLADADRALISEVPFDVQRLAPMVVADRQRNPSRYAVVVVSEGASMLGGEIVEAGQEDAFGHKKLGGIGPMTSEALKKLTGLEFLNQTLAYLMRAGPPDSLDRMVAISYGNLAMQQMAQGNFGRMVAVQKGCFTTVPVDTAIQGKRQVDVKEFYDEKEYRPKVKTVVGKPMFLY